MIQAYFGLKRPPFSKELKTDQMFESFDIREAMARLHTSNKIVASSA